MTDKLILLDMDIFTFRAAAAGKGSFQDAKENLDTRLAEVMNTLESDRYLGFYTPRGRENIFRYHLNPTYKANRPPPPEILSDVRKYAADTYEIVTGNFCEADDLLRMYTNFDTIAVTNDKDALTYEGSVYDFTKNILHHISEKEGAFNFYCQMLIGDYIDGVRGVDRIGKKTAPKKLSGLTPNEMHEVVRDLYDNDARFILNFNLLRMWNKQWELYDGNTVIQYNSYEDFMAALTALKEELQDWKNEDDLDLTVENDLD